MPLSTRIESLYWCAHSAAQLAASSVPAGVAVARPSVTILHCMSVRPRPIDRASSAAVASSVRGVSGRPGRFTKHLLHDVVQGACPEQHAPSCGCRAVLRGSQARRPADAETQAFQVQKRGAHANPEGECDTETGV